MERGVIANFPKYTLSWLNLFQLKSMTDFVGRDLFLVMYFYLNSKSIYEAFLPISRHVLSAALIDVVSGPDSMRLLMSKYYLISDFKCKICNPKLLIGKLLYAIFRAYGLASLVGLHSEALFQHIDRMDASILMTSSDLSNNLFAYVYDKAEIGSGLSLTLEQTFARFCDPLKGGMTGSQGLPLLGTSDRVFNAFFKDLEFLSVSNHCLALLPNLILRLRHVLSAYPPLTSDCIFNDGGRETHAKFTTFIINLLFFENRHDAALGSYLFSNPIKACQLTYQSSWSLFLTDNPLIEPLWTYLRKIRSFGYDINDLLTDAFCHIKLHKVALNEIRESEGHMTLSLLLYWTSRNHSVFLFLQDFSKKVVAFPALRACHMFGQGWKNISRLISEVREMMIVQRMNVSELRQALEIIDFTALLKNLLFLERTLVEDGIPVDKMTPESAISLINKILDIY